MAVAILWCCCCAWNECTNEMELQVSRGVYQVASFACVAGIHTTGWCD